MLIDKRICGAEDWRSGAPWRDLPERFGSCQLINASTVGLKNKYSSKYLKLCWSRTSTG